ncbi:hypothetical protein [Thiomicrorhabdus lithotrophica]|uniref:Uncharacterized protein n=1 Tax=Thiomicrorhabdus lithotrophica TaxID=2949997 RepID=A0ABY8CG61_9GAMM|nr:hypothetical protein [Thiomicrorhabdus lithotrophica]WEJ63138.1 hypothetical protein NR989_02490 [Thiomicrorhabdus lithotrophica]
MLALLGDSHTRSYKVSDVVATRIFLAPGRRNNFKNNLNLFTTTLRYLRAASKLKSGGLDLAFIIGEPDIRWLAYGRMDIGKNEAVFESEKQLSVDEKALNKLVLRFKLFLIITQFFKYQPSVIIGSGTPNPEIVLASSFLNEKLSNVCKDFGCLFFDPQKFSVLNQERVSEKFIGYSVFNSTQKDWTHLSTAISSPFEEFVRRNHYQQKSVSFGWKKNANFEKYFVEIQNFNTYTPKELWPKKLVKLIGRRIKLLR